VIGSQDVGEKGKKLWELVSLRGSKEKVRTNEANGLPPGWAAEEQKRTSRDEPGLF